MRSSAHAVASSCVVVETLERWHRRCVIRSPMSGALELILAGDVMTGRGVDQILPYPVSPEIYEDYLRDARDYVTLAEQKHGAIPRPVAFDYPWGDALGELRSADVRIVNLETSVTSSDRPWPDKGINYRMDPRNVGCLTAAGLDVVSLANNHVLDWGHRGLIETLATLKQARVQTAGAGPSATEAEAPAICGVKGRRVVVLAAAEPMSGVPLSWEAKPDRAGIVVVRDLDDDEAAALASRAERTRRSGDVVVVSIHWGSNWGYEVDPAHVRFAHTLIERGIDVVFGHSSHHARPIEIHRGKPILYGCGDLINDYEGIAGYEAFRQDLVLLYALRFGSSGDLDLRMRPFRLRKMRLERATDADADWLASSLDACSRAFGTRIVRRSDGWLSARWSPGSG